MQFPERIITFLNEAHSIDIGYGGFTFFPADTLEKEQTSYNKDSKNDSAAYEENNGWKKEWIVIGLDDLVGDPIFVDTSTPSFVVMTAEYAEEWNFYAIADSIESFSEIIQHIDTLSQNRTTPQDFAKNPISKKEKRDFLSAIQNETQNSEIEYWESFLELE